MLNEFSKDIENEISFMLTNYKNIDNLIRKRKKQLLETINEGKDAWEKSKSQIVGHTIEDVIIQIDEDGIIKRLNKYKKFLNDFFFNLYINEDFVFSAYIKLKYLRRKNEQFIEDKLNLSFDEINFIDDKLKRYIYNEAVKYRLYANNQEVKCNEQCKNNCNS